MSWRPACSARASSRTASKATEKPFLEKKSKRTGSKVKLPMVAMPAFTKLGQEDGELELPEESNPQIASCRSTGLKYYKQFYE